MYKKVFTPILLVLLLTIIAVGCAPAAESESSQAEETETVKVFGAFATPIEEPWDGVVHSALQKVADEGLIDYTYTEDIGYSGDMERVLREVCEEQSPDLIVGDSYGNEEAARRVAADYPEIAFAFGSGVGPTDPNFAVFDNWLQEPAYMLGMLAGGLTETDVVGVVAAQPVPEVNRIVNAFIGGAKEVNPDVTVLVSFINGWFDPATAKEQAQAHIDSGADVLFAERFGVVEAAAENGLWAFGNMSDQYELAPEVVVSSTVWDWEPTIRYLAKQVKAGSFEAIDLKDFSMVAKGGASMAPYHDTEDKIPQDLKDLVDERYSQLLEGSFRVDINDSPPEAIN